MFAPIRERLRIYGLIIDKVSLTYDISPPKHGMKDLAGYGVWDCARKGVSMKD